VVVGDGIALERAAAKDTVLAIVMDVVVAHDAVTVVGHRYAVDEPELIVDDLPPIDSFEGIVRRRGDQASTKFLEHKILHGHKVAGSARVADNTSRPGGCFDEVASRIIEKINRRSGVIEVELTGPQCGKASHLP